MTHYSAGDWAAEMVALHITRAPPAPCPHCGRTGFYGPRHDGASRMYRACKFCGFWQNVGQPVVPHSATVHDCAGWPTVAGARYIWWVSPLERTYNCPYCKTQVDVPSATVPKPVDDGAHPWAQMPQGLSFADSHTWWKAHGHDGPHL